MSPENKFAEWTEQMSLMYQDISVLLINREIYLAFDRAVQPRPNPDGAREKFFFYWWCCGNYGAAIAVAIRRHATRGRDTSGLISLLEDFVKGPEVLSLQRFIKPYSAGAQDSARAWFAYNFDAGATHVPKERIGRDIGRLESTAGKISQFATHWLAHLLTTKARAYERDFTADEAHGCLQVIEEIFERYYTLFKPYRNVELWPLEVFHPVKIIRASAVTESALKKMWQSDCDKP